MRLEMTVAGLASGCNGERGCQLAVGGSVAR